jgi:hypothetical protein
MAKKITQMALILALLIIPLSISCTAKTSSLPTTLISLSSTNTVNPTLTSNAVPVSLADQGKLLLNGQVFDFKRVEKWGDTVISFQGVTFAPVIPKATITAPVVYWFTVSFKDGKTEDLQYILYLNDVQNDGNLNIETTKHDIPRAGIMLGHQNGRTVMYLLVSE